MDTDLDIIKFIRKFFDKTIQAHEKIEKLKNIYKNLMKKEEVIEEFNEIEERLYTMNTILQDTFDEGILKGEEKERIKIIQLMYSNYCPISDIARYLSMNEKEIRKILEIDHK